MSHRVGVALKKNPLVSILLMSLKDLLRDKQHLHVIFAFVLALDRMNELFNTGKIALVQMIEMVQASALSSKQFKAKAELSL